MKNKNKIIHSDIKILAKSYLINVRSIIVWQIVYVYCVMISSFIFSLLPDPNEGSFLSIINSLFQSLMSFIGWFELSFSMVLTLILWINFHNLVQELHFNMLKLSLKIDFPQISQLEPSFQSYRRRSSPWLWVRRQNW